jgi:RNA polymerase sigma factor (sigma-70 family)
MATGQLGTILQQLQRASLLEDGAGLRDGELLERFLARRDEAAFEALVRRHGPMVFRVCRRVLNNEADAEDAFQATFLDFVRKAAAITPRTQVANGLYGVAYRTAMKARTMSAKRHERERQTGSRPRLESRPEVWERLQALLDEELNGLPDKYRVPIVLCDLEGRPIKEAARQLGWPQGTVASRLARGRALLARRVARHGVTLSSGALAVMLSQGAEAGVSPMVVGATVKAALCVAAGGAAASVISARVAALTEGVIKTMLLNKLKLTAGLVLLVLLGLGALGLPGRAPAREQKPGQKAPGPGPGPASPKSPVKRAGPGRIYFQRNVELASIRPDGKELKRLLAIAEGDWRGYLSPDGKRLAFVKGVIKEENGGFGPGGIRLRGIDKTADWKVLLQTDGVAIPFCCWSPDGKKLAYTMYDQAHLVNMIVDVQTKKITMLKLPRYEVKDKQVYMTLVAWSPDGAWFLTKGDGLHLVKADGSASRRLTTDSSRFLGGSFRFSHNGREVLCAGYANDQRKDRSMALYVLDVASGKVRSVAEAKNFGDLHACWSPDGRRIAYCVRILDNDGKCTGETSIFVTDTQGRNTETVLTEKHQPNLVWLRLLGWR